MTSKMVRFRLKKTLQYLFLASVVLLVWREFERIDGKHSGKSEPVPIVNVAEKQPLVAGVNVQQQRPARRSVGGGGDDGAAGAAGGGVRGGARGREPLWENNNNNNNNKQVEQDKVNTQRNSSENLIKGRHVAAKQNSAKEKPDNQESPKVLSVTVEEPKKQQNNGGPLVQIKDLSNLMGRQPAPVANFTIIVQNGNVPEKPLLNKQTELSDVYIGVKTTEKYHKERLQVILDTWYSLAPEQTNFFTDVDDAAYQQKSNGHMINTQCQGTHSRLALCCKTSVMFNMFYKSNKRWLCHMDDDNYLNVPELMKLLRQFDHNQDHYLGRASLSHPIEAIDRDTNQRVSFWFATGGAGFCISKALAMKMAVYASSGTFERMCNRIRLPDDVTIGFIIEVLLKKPLTKVQTFNSHLQQLRAIPTNQLHNQITLSYSINPKRTNIINMPSSLFRIDEDPTRFKAFHCTYFRGFGNCPSTS